MKTKIAEQPVEKLHQIIEEIISNSPKPTFFSSSSIRSKLSKALTENKRWLEGTTSNSPQSYLLHSKGPYGIGNSMIDIMAPVKGGKHNFKTHSFKLLKAKLNELQSDLGDQVEQYFTERQNRLSDQRTNEKQGSHLASGGKHSYFLVGVPTPPFALALPVSTGYVK